MFVTVLGSAAGGGFPQWNCNCDNCLGLKQGTIKATPRTQSSIAISDNQTDWIVCNASPDILTQIQANPELQAPPDIKRGTAIGSIILTDSQIDHTLGLLNLREGCPHKVWCTKEVRHDLTTSFPVFNMLKHWNGGIEQHMIDVQTPFKTAVCQSIEFTPVPIHSNAPPYSDYRDRPLPGHNITLFIRDTVKNSSLFYIPGVAQATPQIVELMQKADCLLIDGTLWKDQEMKTLGFSDRSGMDMGHLAVGEQHGILSLLGQLTGPRKILIHINNTNPILNEDSPERARLNEMGVEVSYDGMKLNI